MQANKKNIKKNIKSLIDMVVGGGNLSNGMEALVKHVPPEALCIIYTFLYDFFFFPALF